ncbi:Mur ligase middle domain-containing protein [Hyphomicrobium denitrificans 1NES1]|uniref:Mur ligase middle domain-containing protein n=2 Tax=Hyphomicrobium denitrificans TaxID=53399 RepID=N0B583_9HYPH|nr:Mur ligase middle domain-containing protein [Hyphomicrobium denitrificans 1NES1]
MKLKTRETCAKIKRKRTSGTIIAVTGSSVKTTTVALLSHILAGDAKVSSQFLCNGYSHAIDSLLNLRSDTRYAVIEQGTKEIGQIPRAAKLIKPDVAVITLVAIEHYRAFRTIEAVAQEKAALVEAVPDDGLVVLNFDNPHVRAMADLTRARSITFGTMGGDYIAREVGTGTDGFLFLTLTGGGQSIHLKTQLLGAHNWLTVAAAATTALELGVPSETVRVRIESFEPIVERMSLHVVPDGSRIILDTVKAPYHSILLPLEALKTLAAPKKRFIMEQISDYAGNATKKYKDTYAAAAKIADEVCFVGPWVHKARAPAADIESGKFRAFANVEALAAYLRETALKDEVILVKSAGNLHLERLLLDRIAKVRCWPNECGHRGSCQQCGLYERAFHEHNGQRRYRRKLRRSNKIKSWLSAFSQSVGNF